MDDYVGFSIYYYHGGKFMTFGGKDIYFGGDVAADHFYCPDRIQYSAIRMLAEGLGYKVDQLMYRVPGMSLKTGLRLLSNDQELTGMIEHVKCGNDKIDVYVKGEKVDVDEAGPSNNGKGIAALAYEGLPIVVTQNVIEADLSYTDNEIDVMENLTEAPSADLEHDSDVEDLEYSPPVDISDTDDGLDDDEMSDDDEYIECRQLRAQSKMNMQSYEKVGELKKQKQKEKNKQGEGAELESDYEDSDCDINSIGSSEDEKMDEVDRLHRKMRVLYDPNCDHKTLKFVVGMRFEDRFQLKNAVQRWGILNGINLKIVRSNEKKFEIKCRGVCNWRLYASMITKEENFAIQSTTVVE